MRVLYGFTRMWLRGFGFLSLWFREPLIFLKFIVLWDSYFCELTASRELYFRKFMVSQYFNFWNIHGFVRFFRAFVTCTSWFASFIVLQEASSGLVHHLNVMVFSPLELVTYFKGRKQITEKYFYICEKVSQIIFELQKRKGREKLQTPPIFYGKTPFIFAILLIYGLFLEMKGETSLNSKSKRGLSTTSSGGRLIRIDIFYL